MSLKAFMAQNALKPENEMIVVSERFINEDGKPEKWEIKAISQKEDQELRKSATKVRGGKRGRPRVEEMDMNEYLTKTVAAAVVHPNLNDAGLQDSYGAHGAEDLIQKMLTAGEYTELLIAVQELSGFDVDDEELEEEAKN